MIGVGDRVEIGLRYRMAEHPPFTGRHTLEPDEWTGVCGDVVRVDGDDLEIERANGLTVWVHRDRVRPIVGGRVQPSTDEQRWPDAIERGRRRRLAGGWS